MLAQSRLSSEPTGNPYNMAPELHEGRLTTKSDVFSFGLLFAGVIVRALAGTGRRLMPTGSFPYPQRFELGVEAVSRLRCVGLEAVADLLERCLPRKPKVRIDTVELTSALTSLPLPPSQWPAAAGKRDVDSTMV